MSWGRSDRLTRSAIQYWTSLIGKVSQVAGFPISVFCFEERPGDAVVLRGLQSAAQYLIFVPPIGTRTQNMELFLLGHTFWCDCVGQKTLSWNFDVRETCPR